MRGWRDQPFFHARLRTANVDRKSSRSSFAKHRILTTHWMLQLQRPWLITKKQYSTRKVAVGTVKKPMAATAYDGS